MIELVVTCRDCRRSWIPLHADFVRGTWKVCSRCRIAEDEVELFTLRPCAECGAPTDHDATCDSCQAEEGEVTFS